VRLGYPQYETDSAPQDPIKKAQVAVAPDGRCLGTVRVLDVPQTRFYEDDACFTSPGNV
jgi:hypothetical protein